MRNVEAITAMGMLPGVARLCRGAIHAKPLSFRRRTRLGHSGARPLHPFLAQVLVMATRPVS